MIAPPRRSDRGFLLGLTILGSSYVLLIVAMLIADLTWTTSAAVLLPALREPEVRYAIRLSLLSSSVTTILSLWVAIPLGYLLARYSFRGRLAIEAILDIPIVLPPLVVGLSLLLLFQSPPGLFLQRFLPVTYQIPSVILAQFAVACAFAVRTMRVTFEQIPVRREQVALTLGCSRSQAFWRVVLPEARRGILTAATLCWGAGRWESLGRCWSSPAPPIFRRKCCRRRCSSEGRKGASSARRWPWPLVMIVTAALVLLIVRLFGQERGGPS